VGSQCRATSLVAVCRVSEMELIVVD